MSGGMRQDAIFMRVLARYMKALCLHWIGRCLWTGLKYLTKKQVPSTELRTCAAQFCSARHTQGERPPAFYIRLYPSHCIDGRTSYRRVDCRGSGCQACGVLHVLEGPEERHGLGRGKRKSCKSRGGEGEARRGVDCPLGGKCAWKDACSLECGVLFSGVLRGWLMSMD